MAHTSPSVIRDITDQLTQLASKEGKSSSDEDVPAWHGVTFCRTCHRTRLYLALLCICDMRALDAMDRDALTAQYGLLFMVIVASCLYNTRCVDGQLVLYAWCYGLCTRWAARDDVI
jgi:hypothetical protein